MLVTVAPLTMSICAVWYLVVSLIRMGKAYALISLSLGFPFGYCSTATLVILVPLRISCTWTGPHWVEATAPVTVDVATGRDELDDPGDLEELEPGLFPDPLPLADPVDPVDELPLTFGAAPPLDMMPLEVPADIVLEVEVW